MKKPHPLRMINAGRYKVCFSELSTEIQEDVLKHMARLIEENLKWYDRGNYGHLCNILPTILHRFHPHANPLPRWRTM